MADLACCRKRYPQKELLIRILISTWTRAIFTCDLRTGLHSGTAQPRFWVLLKRLIVLLFVAVCIGFIAMTTGDIASRILLGEPVCRSVRSHLRVPVTQDAHKCLYGVFRKTPMVILLLSHFVTAMARGLAPPEPHLICLILHKLPFDNN